MAPISSPRRCRQSCFAMLPQLFWLKPSRFQPPIPLRLHRNRCFVRRALRSFWGLSWGARPPQCVATPWCLLAWGQCSGCRPCDSGGSLAGPISWNSAAVLGAQETGPKGGATCVPMLSRRSGTKPVYMMRKRAHVSEIRTKSADSTETWSTSGRQWLKLPSFGWCHPNLAIVEGF